MQILPIILASQSPNRLELLQRINIIPDRIVPSNIDETEKKGELPANVASRLAYEKAMFVSDKVGSGIIIAADSVVAKGRRTLPKALNVADIRYCMNMLSGCRHNVYTGVAIIKKEKNTLKLRQKLVKTTVQFKRLALEEIEFYCDLGEGLNKAGGYSIGGFAESFVSFISGSHSNVIGLPLMETKNMLNSLGYNCHGRTLEV